MPASPYKAVNWSEEPITTNKLNQMSNNSQWLFENLPRIRYSNSGITKESGLKILTGQVTITPPANATTTSRNVSFGNFFTPNIFPIVILSTSSATTQRGIYTSCSALTGQGRPTSQGANIFLYALANQTLRTTVYVNYIAIGI